MPSIRAAPIDSPRPADAPIRAATKPIVAPAAPAISGSTTAEDVAAGPANGSGVIDQDLNKQVALILRQLDGEIRVVRDESRHDIAHDQLFRYGREMDAAHPGKVCFHEITAAQGCAEEIAA